MKKTLLLLIITSIAFTQTKWRQSYLDTLDGLVYSPTSEKPYTGKVFELYNNGANKLKVHIRLAVLMVNGHSML